MAGKSSSNRSHSSSGRLFVVLAREAPVGVIFRRGPSGWVEVIRWDTASDAFERGHWFHGRIHEESIDLTPDGSLLIYFATKYNRHTLWESDIGPAWTAISRPPWLTALALWPKHRGTPGGGLFWDEKMLWLNHSPGAMPHREHKPHGLDIRTLAAHPGRPLPEARLYRDGWRQVEESGEWERLSPRGMWSLVTERPEYDRPSGYWIINRPAELRLPLQEVQWANWDQRGRLAFSVGGKLFAAEPSEAGEMHPRELADFTADNPQARKTPEWAKMW